MNSNNNNNNNKGQDRTRLLNIGGSCISTRTWMLLTVDIKCERCDL